MPINYKNYPPDWKEIRARILKRSENEIGKPCCEVCGVENYAVWSKLQSKTLDKSFNTFKEASEHIKKLHCPKQHYVIVLTIAHLDHDAENWNVQDDRLKAMCQSCHLIYDAQHKADKKKIESAKGRYKDSMFPL